VTFKVNGLTIMSRSGIPFMYGSGDVDTVSSNETKIVATDSSGNDAAAGDQFGTSVAVGSGRVVVGAPYYNDTALNLDSGSAYIYDLDGIYVSKITYGSADAGDLFGTSVAVGSSRIVVGAPGNDYTPYNQAGSAHIYDLNGNLISAGQNPLWAQDDLNTGSDRQTDAYFGWSVAVGSGRIVVGAPDFRWFSSAGPGSAYIFDVNGNWIAKIVASDATNADQFGYSVAVGSGKIVVGSPFDDDTALGSGSAYIFDVNGNEIKKIVASDAGGLDNFGHSVAVGSGRIVVGAPLDGDTAGNSGSAYIFDLDGNLIKKIVASDPALSDQFGTSVAVGSGRIVVGALNDDDTADNSGSVYVFDLDGTQLEKIVASDAAGADYFGTSVAVGCGRIVAGAYLDDDTADSSGSAYIFDTPDVITPFDVKDWESGY
jgi:hypothetical protein